jgi:aspartyl-tRNA(Asn)/glutamyl-tRNA(Gln) amidotransferase subunit A
MYLADIATIPVNMAGLPAISVPCGLDDGMPVGLQIVGPAFGEQRILDVAYAYQKMSDFPTRFQAPLGRS